MVERNAGFQQLVSKLPMNRLLTETDSPYQGPDRGERNDPSTVPRGVVAMAKVRHTAGASAPIKQDYPLSPEFDVPLSDDSEFADVEDVALRLECNYVRNRIRQNFYELFGI